MDLNFHADGADFVADRNDVIVRTSAEGVTVTDRVSGKGILWRTEAEPTVSGKDATFEGPLGLTWVYRPTVRGVESFASVSSPLGERAVVFKYRLVGGADPLAEKDGSLSSGELFTVDPPVAVAPDRSRYPVGTWRLGPGSGEITVELNDSALPAQAYPYQLDPDVTFNSQASGDDGYVSRSGSAYPPAGAITFNTTDSSFYVERSLFGGSYTTSVGLVRWNTSSLPDGATVLSASVHSWNSCNFIDRYITADWYSSWPIDSADWTPYAGTTASGSPGWGSPYMTFPLADVAANVSKTGYTGLRLYVGGPLPTTSQECSFDSFDWSWGQELDVTWDGAAPPTPAPIAPAADSVVSSLNPSFSAAAVADPDGEAVSYDFRISSDPDGVGSVVESGWLSTPQWTAPAGSLVDGAKYYWSVAAKGTSFVSAWSLGRAFKVDLGLGVKPYAPYDEAGPVTVNLASGNAFLSIGMPSVSAVGGKMGLTLSYNSSRPLLKGLTGRYYLDSDADQVFDAEEPAFLSRLDPTISFIYCCNLPDMLARWTGYVTIPATAPASGSYKFGTAATGGSRVWIGSTKVFDSWTTGQNGVGFGDPVTLAAGQKTAITVEYYGSWILYDDLRVNGPVGSGGAVQEAPVPSDWLSADAPGLPDGWDLSADVDGDLLFTSAKIGKTEVILSSSDGATHTYRWTGSAWAPPDGEDGILTADTQTGLLVLQAEDGRVYSFNADGKVAKVQSAVDDSRPAAPIYTWGTPTSNPNMPVRLEKIADPVADPSSSHPIALTYWGDTGCPTATGYDNPGPTYMLCKVDYSNFGLGEVDFYYSGGHLARITSAGGSVADFGYEGGKLTQIRDVLTNDLIANGTIVLPPESDPTYAVEVAKHATLITYTSEGKVASVTSPVPAASAPRASHSYEYVSGGTKVHVAGLSEPLGYARQVAFDSGGRLLQSYNLAGKVTTFEWDSGDRLLKTTDPTGLVSTTIYDYAGRPIDSYGPGAASEFASDRTSTTAPHSSTAYDEGMTGLAAAWWDNPNLVGPPKAHTTLSLTPVDQNSWPDWGTGSPAGMPADNFSGRLTGDINVPATGAYGFTANVDADDGVRVYVDDSRVIDRWDPYKATVLADSPQAYWRLG
ncbi:MAG: PA14 domain-containing protein, partial [Actinobacteria bacterium]|nr:PA14 domain-containing protein [Actinomycetota bacterium]